MNNLYFVLNYKSTLYLFLFTLYSFVGNINFVSSASPKVENLDVEKISVDYLKDLPINDYILGPGDVLNIRVSRDYPELDSTVNIDREGTVLLPKIKKIYIEGLTTNELTNLLNTAFSEFVKFPSTEIEIKQYRPIRIYVDGEVGNPGLQTLSGAFSIGSIGAEEENENQNQNGVITNYFPTVFDAIRSSGGITQFSNLEEVEVVRINNISNGGGKRKTILNFSNVISYGDNRQNIRIYDGDVINVKKLKNNNLLQLSKAARSNLNPKFINVLVSGRVNNPGNKRLSKSSTLNDGIDMAGGAKVLKGKVRFIRFNNDGTIEQRKLAYSRTSKRGSYKNPYLIDGDIILIDNSFLTSTNEVLTEVTAPISGIFSTYGLLKVITD